MVSSTFNLVVSIALGLNMTGLVEKKMEWITVSEKRPAVVEDFTWPWVDYFI
jgi:hypothetical protein